MFDIQVHRSAPKTWNEAKIIEFGERAAKALHMPFEGSALDTLLGEEQPFAVFLDGKDVVGLLLVRESYLGILVMPRYPDTLQLISQASEKLQSIGVRLELVFDAAHGLMH